MNKTKLLTTTILMIGSLGAFAQTPVAVCKNADETVIIEIKDTDKKQVKLELIAHPDLALEPGTSIKIFESIHPKKYERAKDGFIQKSDTIVDSETELSFTGMDDNKVVWVNSVMDKNNPIHKFKNGKKVHHAKITFYDGVDMYKKGIFGSNMFHSNKKKFRNSANGANYIKNYHVNFSLYERYGKGKYDFDWHADKLKCR